MSETRSVETIGHDIEAAIEEGLKQLGVARESVIVEILEEPSRGLLGIGARQARVRLITAARPMTPPAPEPPAPAEAAAPPPAPAAPRPTQPKPPAPPAEEDDTDSDAVIFGELDAVAEEDLDEDARIGLATLEELLSKMEVSAQVKVMRSHDDQENAPWVLQIHGRDLGTLIGRRGETLAALQYIARLIASRELQRRANIVIDVEGYKARREKMLRRLAKRMADQAIQTGRTVALEPMPAYERRIVHLALRDNQEVTTESTGEGDHRKVTIIPRRQ